VGKKSKKVDEANARIKLVRKERKVSVEIRLTNGRFTMHGCQLSGSRQGACA
jgi:hypothetical protein